MLLLSPSLVNFIKNIYFFSTVSFPQVLEPSLTEPGRKEGLKLFFSYFKIIPQKSSFFIYNIVATFSITFKSVLIYKRPLLP